MTNGKLCEECTKELLMVAKFREKCEMSTVALDQLKLQINKMSKVEESERMRVETVNSEENSNSDSDSETVYENIEYTDENIEYVIYDTNNEFMDASDVTVETHETLPRIKNDIPTTEDFYNDFYSGNNIGRTEVFILL